MELNTLADVLAEVLGEEPTMEAVDKRCNTEEESVELSWSFFEKYNENPVEMTPKRTGESRPVFTADFVLLGGESQKPFQREYSFVRRGLMYNESVAVLNNYDSESVRADPEMYIRSGGVMRPNGVWAAKAELQRIARYAGLERAGLLHYVNNADGRKYMDAARGRLESLERDSGFDVSDLTFRDDGFDVDNSVPHLTSINMPEPVADEYRGWISGVVRDFVDYVDLFIPAWLGGIDAYLPFEALFAEVDSRVAARAARRALLFDISLPSLQEDSVLGLTPEEFMRIRETGNIESLRSLIGDGYARLSVSGDAEERREISREVTSRSQELVESVALLDGVRWDDAIKQGVVGAALGGVAALVGGGNPTIFGVLGAVSASAVKRGGGTVLGPIKKNVLRQTEVMPKSYIETSEGVIDVTSQSSALRSFMSESPLR